MVLSLALCLTGCDIFGQQSVPATGRTFPTITLIPTETPIPTVTPIPTRVTQTQTPVSILSLFNTPNSIAPDQTGTGQPGAIQTQPAAPPLPAATDLTQTPAAANTSLPVGQLPGRFLGLIPSSQGLWAMRADGTHPTLLTADPIYGVSISPTGWAVAYVTNPDPQNYQYQKPFGYTLKIITLYNDRIITVTSLDPPGLSDSSPADTLDSAFQSISAYGQGAMTWSPDGGTLAFTSAHQTTPDQPASSDIYLYSLSSATIRRMTHLQVPQGPAHPYALSWSPYGQSLFFAAAYSFGKGSGYLMAGAWVTGLDGSSRQVAPGETTTDEKLIAWLDGSQVLLSSSNGSCGNQDLRAFNFRTGEARMLWPGCYGTAFYDRLHNEVLVNVAPDQVLASGGNQPGVYLVSIADGKARVVTNHSFERILSGSLIGKGSADWYGYNRGEGLSGIQRTGQVIPLFTGPPYDGSTGQSLNPYRRLPDGSWLWTGDGLYLSQPGGPLGQIMDVPVQNFTESPIGPGLYFFLAPDKDTTRVYGIRSRDWKPFVVDPRIADPQEIDWTG